MEGELSTTKDGYTVTITFTKEAKIPEDSCVSATELLPGSSLYTRCYLSAIQTAGLTEDTSLSAAQARFFDISILTGEGDDMYKIEPATPVNVCITYNTPVAVGQGGELNVLHFSDVTGTPSLIGAQPLVEPDAGALVSGVSFDSDSFSIFGIINTTILEGTLSSDGSLYKVTLAYGDDAKIPSDAHLEVSEIGIVPNSTEHIKGWRKKRLDTKKMLLPTLACLISVLSVRTVRNCSLQKEAVFPFPSSLRTVR